MRQRLEDPAYRMRFGAAYLTRKVRALEQRTLSKVLALEQRTLLGYLLRPSSKRLASRALHADGLNIHELMHLCSWLMHLWHAAHAAAQAAHDTRSPRVCWRGEARHGAREDLKACASTCIRYLGLCIRFHVITEPSCPFSSPFWPLLPPSPVSAVTTSATAVVPRFERAPSGVKGPMNGLL